MDTWINLLIGGVVTAVMVGFLYALATRLESAGTAGASA